MISLVTVATAVAAGQLTVIDEMTWVETISADMTRTRKVWSYHSGMGHRLYSGISNSLIAATMGRDTPVVFLRLRVRMADSMARAI